MRVSHRVLSVLLLGLLQSAAAVADCGCPTTGCDSSFWSDNTGCDGLSDCELACDAIGCQARGCALLEPDCSASYYVSLFGGWNELGAYNGAVINPVPTVREGTFNDGWLIGGAIGRRINESLRAEAEFSFRDNTADQWVVNSVPQGDWDGHFNNYSLMANLFYDFQSVEVLGFTPYVGGGIGIAFLDGEFATSTINLEVEDELFAFQFIAGASKTIADSADLFVEYRYYETSDYELTNVTAMPPAMIGEDAYDANNVLFGLRFYR